MDTDLRPPATAPPEQLLDLLRTLRSIRRLRPDPLPERLLEDLVRAASWGPSPHNAQGHRFVVVTDRARMARLAELWQQVVNDFLAGQEHLDLPTSDAGAHQRMLAAIRYQRDHFADTPALIAACQPRVSSGSWPARFRATAGMPLRRRLAAMRIMEQGWTLATAAAVYPAVQNLLIAARAHGVGGTLTLWHLWREADFQQALDLPPEVRILALVPLGYPKGNFGPVRRNPVGEFTFRDGWARPWVGAR